MGRRVCRVRPSHLDQSHALVTSRCEDRRTTGSDPPPVRGRGRIADFGPESSAREFHEQPDTREARAATSAAIPPSYGAAYRRRRRDRSVDPVRRRVRAGGRTEPVGDASGAGGDDPRVRRHQCRREGGAAGGQPDGGAARRGARVRPQRCPLGGGPQLLLQPRILRSRASCGPARQRPGPGERGRRIDDHAAVRGRTLWSARIATWSARRGSWWCREDGPQWSKDEILGAYLNTIYFGRTAYGIAQGSRAFFDKPVEELTLAEGAVLASVIQSPSLLDPATDPDALRERWNYVLDGMVEMGVLGPPNGPPPSFPRSLPVAPPNPDDVAPRSGGPDPDAGGRGTRGGGSARRI